MSVNLTNFAKSVPVPGRFSGSILSISRVERTENGVSVNALEAIQRALEHAWIESPDGALRVLGRRRHEQGLNGCEAVADPSMPGRVRFQ